MENVKYDKLDANIRMKTSAHSSKKERMKGLVPGVLYGRGIQSVLFEIGELELNSYFSKNG